MAVRRIGMQQMTVYVPEALYETLRTEAFYERKSMNAIIVEAIEVALSQRKRRGGSRAPGGHRKRS